MKVLTVVKAEAHPDACISHKVTGQSAVCECVKMSVNPVATVTGEFPGVGVYATVAGTKLASASAAEQSSGFAVIVSSFVKVNAAAPSDGVTVHL